MDSLLWDVRTVLASTAQLTLPLTSPDDETTQVGSGSRSTKSPGLGPLHVWNYLVSLSEQDDSPGTDSNDKTSKSSGPKLKHFRPADFGRTWDAVPTEIGSGVSYSVEKCTLAQPDSKGKPVVVAVKRLKVFRDRGATVTPGHSSGSDSAALHVSVATVLKELRILTHPPLRRHPNIASLLGYRSEFGLTDAALAHRNGASVSGLPHQSSDVSLVMEFAEYGTLRDFLRQTKLGLKDRGHLLRDIASGLDALHRCGIAHGDVKLENTLVFFGEHRIFAAKLSDFGHALVDLDKNDTAPQKRRYLGTPLMNAPEVRPRDDLDSPVVIQPPTEAEGFYKCDIYSFGLLVWEVILEGARFCTELLDVIPGHEQEKNSMEQIVYRLNGLPREELLLRALTSLRTRHDGGKKYEVPLVGMLRKVLQASLRDDPKDRRTAAEIVKVFEGQKVFYDDKMLSNMFNEDKPRPSFLPPATIRNGVAPAQHTTPAPQMPPIVQADLVRRLRITSSESASSAERALALYDLAMCTLTRFSVSSSTSFSTTAASSESPDLDNVLSLLTEAATLGSSLALSLVFRLHSVLGREIPPALRASQHPIAVLETEKLEHVDSGSYLLERVRLYEKLAQEDSLQGRWDVLHKGEVIFPNVLIEDVQDLLKEGATYDPEELECVRIRNPEDPIIEEPGIEGRLIHVAARLGLLALLKWLLVLPAPVSGKKHWEILSGSSKRSDDLLASACRGGHLQVLEYLVLEAGAQPAGYNGRGTTALHWLVMFRDSESAKRALVLLLETQLGKASLQVPLPPPGLLLAPHVRLSGTPLEIAIAMNNTPLLEAILSSPFATTFKDRLRSLGWTGETFSLAASLHLSSLLPVLLPLQEEYLRTRPTFAPYNRYNRSRGIERDLPPFGLVEISRPPDPILPLLIHGTRWRDAVGETIDAIINAGACSVTDEDGKGSTALTHAVRYAPAEFGFAEEVVSALVSRGGKFGREETASRVISSCLARRTGRSGEGILRVLLQTGVLPLNTEALIAAVQTGKVELVETLLSFPDPATGKPLDVSQPIIQEGESLSILFFAVTAPNNAPTVRLLLDRGADVDSIWEGKSVLEAVTSLPNSDAETIDLLISRGAKLVRNGFTILHRTACSRSVVGTLHVLFHLLSHPEVRRLVDVPTSGGGANEPTVTPLYMACFGGIPAAVHALLQAGAKVITPVGMPSPVDTAICVGRRPGEMGVEGFDHKNNKVGAEGGEDTETALYDFRRQIEDVVLALLDRSEPGHGRTRLHVAAALGSKRRVVELVEREGYRAFQGDKDKLLPGAYVEDVDTLAERGEEEAYLENLREVAQYLRLKVIEEVCGDDPDDPDRIRDYLADRRLDDDADGATGAKEKEAVAQLEAKMEELQIAREEMDCWSIGNGRESPSEVAVRLEASLAAQMREHGNEGDEEVKDIRMLRVLDSLSEIYAMTGRADEAAELYGRVLRGRKAQLPADHKDLWKSYMDHMIVLILQGKVQEAKTYGLSLAEQALDTFEPKHPIVLSIAGNVAFTERLLGNVKEAVSKQELALALFDERVLEFSLPKLSDNFLLTRTAIRSNLTHDYCLIGDLDSARKTASQLSWQLEITNPNIFFQMFDIVMGIGMSALDICGLDEEAEEILEGVVKTCLKKHGKRKASYCLRTALQRLATYYMSRKKWEKEAETLRMLADLLAVTLGAGHPDTLKVVLDLSESLSKLERWLEAGILQEQVLDGLRRLPVGGSQDRRKIVSLEIRLCVTFCKLGELDKSEHYGREAVRDAEDLIDKEQESGKGDGEKKEAEKQGDNSDLNFRAVDELASTLCYADKVSEAIALQRNLLTALSTLHGPDHAKTLPIRQRLCASLIRARDIPAATAEAETCVNIATSLPEPSPSLASEALYILATCKEVAGELESARDMYREALQLEKQPNGADGAPPPPTKDTLANQRSLVKMCIETELFDEADTVLQEILASAPIVFGTSDNVETQLAHGFLGLVYEEQGRLREAVRQFEASYAIARRLYGDAGEETMECVDHMVRVYIDSERTREAHLLALQLLRWRRENLGEYHEDTVHTKIDLCGTSATQGMWPEAERMQRDVLRYYEEKREKEEKGADASHNADKNNTNNNNGEEDIEDNICILTEFIAESCSKQGRYKQAEESWRAALDSRLRRQGPTNPKTISAMVELAYVLAKSGKDDEADRLSKEAHETALRRHDNTDGSNNNQDSNQDDADEQEEEDPIASTESLRAYILFRQGNFAEAEEMQLRVLARDPGDIEELRFLADLYAKTGRYSEAIETAEAAVAVAEATANDADDETDDETEAQDGKGQAEDGGGEKETKRPSYLRTPANGDLVNALTDMAELYTKTKQWEEAKSSAERARGLIDAWRVPGVYEHTEKYLNVLAVLKMVYGELCEEEKLLDVELAIKAQGQGILQGRRDHLKVMELEAKRFQLNKG